MYTLKYCQLCLVVDVKTFAMNTATLEAYSKLLQLSLHNKEPYICYECSALLLKYQEFHAKCLRAHNVLTHFKTQSSQVITQEIFDAQRKIYNLESKLSLTTILHQNIDFQHDYSRNKVNVSSNIHSEEKCVYSKVSMLHVTNETKPLEYIESASVRDNLTKFKWFDETLEAKPVVTKDIKEIIELTDTSISDVDDEPLHNKRSENRVITTKETNDGTDVNEENNEFADNYFNYLEDEPINDIDSKEDNNGFSDLLLSNLDEIVVSEIRNSEGLVEQASQIAQSVLLEKYSIANEESNVNLDDKLLLNMEYNELVMTATTIAYQVQKKRKQLDVNFFKGFAQLVKLTKEMARNEVLLRKDTSNYRNSAYKCEICFRGFLGEVSYKNHMTKHSKVRPAECEYCHITFAKRKRLVTHVNSFHSYKIICMRCDYVTCSVNEGKVHIGKHKGLTYACDECDLSFRRQNTLCYHKQRTHAREHVCALCGDEFGTARGLAAHKRLLHAQESAAVSGPRCAECAVQFVSEAAYERHLVVSYKHRGAVSNGCKFCGKTFPDATKRRAHVRLAHKRYKPLLLCPECPARLPSAGLLRQHMSARHPRAAPPPPAPKSANKTVYTTVCEYCGKNVNKFQMQYHVLKHTGERPYKCEECGKGFAHPTVFNMHKRTHAPVPTNKLYQCEICSKNLTSKSSLQKHIMTVHSKIRRHACHICGKTFFYLCEVKLHVKYTHENVPWPKRIRKRKAETHN